MSRSRSNAGFWRSRTFLVLTVSGLLAASAAYVFVLPHLQAKDQPFLNPDDLYIPRLVDLTVAAWCFWIGSSIGSFLNVVAWRMPRGESINGRSHCPSCQAKLKSRDNFPVFGWLILAGRCRHCRLPISSRYPIVELIVGLCLLLVAIGQLYALSLPYQRAMGASAALWAPRISPAVLTVLAYHVFAIAISFAFGLIRFDRERLPLRLVAWGLLPMIAAMIAYPFLMMVSWRTLGNSPPPMFSGMSWHIDGAIRILTALVAAAITGRSLARGLCPLADPKLDPLGKSTSRLIDLICLIAVPAIIVGWQSMLALIVVTSVVAVILHRTVIFQADRLGAFAISLPIMLSLHIVLWRKLHAMSWWPSDNSTPMVVIAWAAMILIVPLWLKEKREVAKPIQDEASDEMTPHESIQDSETDEDEDT